MEQKDQNSIGKSLDDVVKMYLSKVELFCILRLTDMWRIFETYFA